MLRARKFVTLSILRMYTPLYTSGASGMSQRQTHPADYEGSYGRFSTTYQQARGVPASSTSLLRSIEPKSRCRPNMAHIRQSRPDSGLGFQVKFVKTFQVVPFALGSGKSTVVCGTQGLGEELGQDRKPIPSTQNSEP